MQPSDSSEISLRLKVGLFTILGLLLIGAITVFVNDRPFWWRACQLVHINVEDATGLKSKSPVKSLGLQIGYLKTIELSETHVRLGICITAPVEVLPDTRAYIRGEGILGDKFVELKPVKYHGEVQSVSLRRGMPLAAAASAAIPAARAARSSTAAQKTREIPVGQSSQDVQHVVDQVDELVGEMRGLTENLKSAIKPEEIKQTLDRLNVTLENASKTLSPEGNLTSTAQRVLAKLEDAIEQFKDQLTRINQGEGSVGRVLNDPKYADLLEEALQNVNRLLSKVGGMRFIVDVGAERLPAVDGSRGWFKLGIWPSPTRYYLFGVAVDPRGKVTSQTTTTTAGNVTAVTETTRLEHNAILLTAMLGKVFFSRLDMYLGINHDDGTLGVGLDLGPNGSETMLQVRNEIYVRSEGASTDSLMHDRLYGVVRPWSSVFLRGGVDSFRKVDGKLSYSFGAGIAFDDQDIKFLFSFL